MKMKILTQNRKKMWEEILRKTYIIKYILTEKSKKIELLEKIELIIIKIKYNNENVLEIVFMF